MVPQKLGPKTKADINAEYEVNGEAKCEKHSIIKGQAQVDQAVVQDGRFPQIGEILNGIDASKQVVLPINAEFLWQLAQAINVPDSSNVVTLLVPAPDKDGLVTKVIGVLSNDDSCRGEHAGGFGIIMPVDAEAAQVRADFKKLVEESVNSLDSAAKTWSEHPIERSQKKNAKKGVVESSAKSSHGKSPARPKAPRKARRRRSVA